MEKKAVNAPKCDLVGTHFISDSHRAGIVARSLRGGMCRWVSRGVGRHHRGILRREWMR